MQPKDKFHVAREAYRLSFNPDISAIYEQSLRWGVDSEAYADSDAPFLTHVREALRDRGMDYKLVTERFCNELARNHGQDRPDRLIEWLMPGGNTRDYSHWIQKEVTADAKRLFVLLRAGGY